MTDTPHYFFVKALSWGADAVAASWSGFFAPRPNGVKREKGEVMHKKI
jgi:hypothetical protein